MRIQLNPEHLSYDDIRRAADAFLGEHPQRVGPPVQIEEIVDLDLGIDIVPVPGLLDELEIDGFMASDLSRIYVDQSVFDHPNENRYRFTLAHEAGHVSLHADIFARFRFSNLDEYRDFIEGIDEDDREWLEHQAYWFAGLVLVPSVPLKASFEQELASAPIQRAVRAAQESGLTREQYLEHLCSRISDRLARHFCVSSQVVEKRLHYDKLAQEIP
jgi:hypothetical protein